MDWEKIKLGGWSAGKVGVLWDIVGPETSDGQPVCASECSVGLWAAG